MDKHIEEWEHLINKLDACETQEELDRVMVKVNEARKGNPPMFDDFLYHRMTSRFIAANERLS